MSPSSEPTAQRRRIALTVNGRQENVEITDGELLVDVLRRRLRLRGTHAGCYNGDCGACTVRVGETIAKSCLLLAASVDGDAITTLEGFSGTEGLSELQQVLWERDAFQCGFCVAGHVFALDDMLARIPEPAEADVREALIGNLCRCTGYVNLVGAVLEVADRRRKRE
ncbi:(2Fe-2S)-binding protein [Amycolatopsis pithecellobii]|uniref:2Fe-2S iron-sulfur cluster binding domain-containing protein n=1 Tax=Amycolatopsis pithecellobii TaxID=664692 RepID=A0A6N7Z5E9_9PSEU|nr:2Fe-2S iron-sulfur cluster-binding protein [Amycolatopsis pithecellobii]MTD54676.1 2Fe-2S iron-sulfur cluster binding domain-containing protein [Amycolatopsis pithecellobii]